MLEWKVMLIGTLLVGTGSSAEQTATADERIQLIRDTNTVFSMTSFPSLADWEKFAAQLRRAVLVSSGLWPMPERTPLNPTVTGRIEREDYIIENLYIEARPGFYVTGNLYRPRGDGPFPAVACPHGHWGQGRFENTELGSVPARSITFARMGMVAFSYDMVGFNDSLQFPKNWAHKYDAIPKEVRQLQALWAIHPFALQLWSSLRVIDFLQSLPYVDRERIACTGASGGGTQTFMLCAIDPRIQVAAPVCMVSHTMQGGCVCENAPLIRFHASNMEIAALMAPKPLILVSASGDWTKETPDVEYPAVRGIYALYSAQDRIENHHFEADHNYNKLSREAVYRFFGKWFLGQEEKYREFQEPPYTIEPPESLRVFPNGQLPERALSDEEVLEQIRKSCVEKWTRILPKSPKEVGPFRETYGIALADVLGAELPASGTVTAESLGTQTSGNVVVQQLVLGRKSHGDRVPAALFRRQDAPTTGLVLAVHGHVHGHVHGQGMVGLVRGDTSQPGPLIQSLLEENKIVLTINPFLIGGDLERKYGKFPDTFLPSDTAYRVQDVLTALAYLRTLPEYAESRSLNLVGLGSAGLVCLLASALDQTVQTTIVDLDQFDVTDDGAWVEQYYVPCLRSIGDIVTASILVAPRTLWLTNAAGALDAEPIVPAFPEGRFHLLREPVATADLVAVLR